MTAMNSSRGGRGPTLVAALCLALAAPAVQAQAPVLTSVRVDGDFAEWQGVLLAPDQVTLDGDGSTIPCNLSPDLDCPIQAGRDMRQFAWTWDSTYLYLYARRQNSVSNEMAFWWYLDLNFDERMGAGDRVLRVRYQGNNRTTLNDLYRYVPVRSGGDAMVDAQGRSDGYTLPGNLDPNPLWSETVPHGGGPMGLRFEERVPWSVLGLAPGTAINFHVSGSNSPNPQNLAQQVDDNLGGPSGGVGTTGWYGVSVEPDRFGSAAVGGSIDYAHVIGSLGNAPATLALSTVSSLALRVELFRDPNRDGVPDALLGLDANGDGDYTDPGDMLGPGADTDGDGLPDTGRLAPGGRFDVVVRVTTRAGLSGRSDATVLTAFATARPDRARDTATDTTGIGAISLLTDRDARNGVAGQGVPYPFQACNQGTTDTIDLTARSARGFDVSLFADPDCDGRQDSFLARDAGGDGTWDVLAGGDSDGDGIPDTGLLGPGECTCFVAVIELPPGLPDGLLEQTTLEARGSAAPTRATLELTTTLAPWLEFFPDRTFAANLDVAVGAGRSAFFPHVLRNNASLDEVLSFSDIPPVNDQAWTVRVWSDPDGDGNAADGRPIDRLGPVPANGGEASVIVEVQIPASVPFGTRSTTTTTASSVLSPGVSEDVVDELAVSRLAAYEDALRSRPAGAFAPCVEIFAEATGLDRRVRPGEDPYDLLWYDGAGTNVRFRDDIAPDVDGAATDEYLQVGTEATGDWLLRLREDGISIHDLPFVVDPSGAVDSLTTDRMLYPLVGDDLIVMTTLRNASAGVFFAGTRIEHVVLDPSSSLWLRSAVMSAYEPWTGLELTRSVGLPTLPPGGVFNDFFVVPTVTHATEGVHTVLTTWRASCGTVLAQASTTFVVGGGELDCTDGIDDDADGLIDCEDPECAADPACFESDCTNGLDDDGDGLVDCEDPDCAADPSCRPEAPCDDGIDNDGDGLVDCDDPDCAGDPACPELDCANGVDDDLDGLVDCEDPDCVLSPACVEIDCANGVDDDGDGAVDCADLDCLEDPACRETACANGLDDDGDGLIDCADPDCADDPACQPEAPCDDGLDNDGDTLIDCADPDCDGDPACPERDCTNGIDDDLDGLIDCADPDCSFDPACREIDCADGVDDDGDGLVDCMDPDCLGDPACRELDCTNGLDDDGDGLIDCEDPDCATHPACREADCVNGLDDDGDGLIDCADPDCAADPACGEMDCVNGLDDDGDGEIDCEDPDCADDPACAETDCTNGLDDDGDGLIDCADPDCLGDPACRETDCANGIDDDGDGAIDCADPDCLGDPACRETDCANGLDDDGDGLVDCADPDCLGDPACREADCVNGLDDDGDGLIDCEDPDCEGDPACTETDCANGLDDDGDGLVDCEDPDCLGDPACPETPCDDGFDNDGDGLVDCDDPDCAADPVCTGEAPCDDGIDGDGDGLIDCDDPDCEFDPACYESDCTNGLDDDGDGLIDCADPDCADDPACVETDCGNGLDDDGDGLVDCEDPDCAGDPACTETDCSNGLDDDGDGLIDCEDPDCLGDPACMETDCANGVDDDGDGLVDCADPDCVDDPACIETNCSNGLDDDGDGLVDCDDPDCVDDPACKESNCSDGLDDDGDGLIDCEDPDCAADPACDCDPGDPAAFAVPPEVELLLVTKREGSLLGPAELRWTDMRPRAGTGTGYDLTGGVLSDLWGDRDFRRARCLANDQGPNLYVDGRLIGRDSDGYYYDVRAVNSCGAGPYGLNSSGVVRQPTACP